MSMLKVETRESAHLKSRVKDMSVVPNLVSFTALLAAITPVAKLPQNEVDGTYDPILIRDTESLIANFGDPRIDPEKYIDLYSIMQLVGDGTSCYVCKVNSGDSGVYELDFDNSDELPISNTEQENSSTITFSKDSENTDADKCIYTSSVNFENYFDIFRLSVVKPEVDSSSTEPATEPETVSVDNGKYSIIWDYDESSSHYILKLEFSVNSLPDVLKESSAPVGSFSANVIKSGDKAKRIMAYSSTNDDITVKCSISQAKPYSLKAFYLNVDLENSNGDKIVSPGAKIKLTNELTNQGIVNNLNSVLGTYVRFELVDKDYSGACAVNDDKDHSIAKALLDANAKHSKYFEPTQAEDTKAGTTVKINGTPEDVDEDYSGEKGNGLTLGISKNSTDDNYSVTLEDNKQARYVGVIASSLVDGNEITATNLGSVIVSDYELAPDAPDDYDEPGYFMSGLFDVIVSSDEEQLPPTVVVPENATSFTLSQLFDISGNLDVSSLADDDSNIIKFVLSGGKDAEPDETSPRENLLDSDNPKNLDCVSVYSSPNFKVVLQDYINAILKYKDKRYTGCVIADMTAPMHSYKDGKDGKYDKEVDEDNDAYNDKSKPASDKNRNFGAPSYEERRSLHYYLKEVAFERKDTTAVLSTPLCKSLSDTTLFDIDEACHWVSSTGDYTDLWDYGSAPTENYLEQSFYLEMYYSWLNVSCTKKVGSKVSSVRVKTAPSCIVINNILRSFRDRGVHYPVAGDQYGTLPSYCSVIVNPALKANRDQLVQYRINPIWDTGTRGVQIYGNETLNAGYTDLNAAHIARTLIYIRSTIDEYTETLKFMINSMILWDTWKNYVSTKILEPLKTASALSSYRVSMGTDTTSPEEIANRKVNGLIELTFYQAAEIFDLTFVVYSSATTVDEANPLT